MVHCHKAIDASLPPWLCFSPGARQPCRGSLRGGQRRFPSSTAASAAGGRLVVRVHRECGMGNANLSTGHLGRALALLLLASIAAGCPRYQRGPTTRVGAKGFVALGGRGAIYVKDLGRGPAVLLIHGYAGAHDHWAPLLPAL